MEYQKIDSSSETSVKHALAILPMEHATQLLDYLRSKDVHIENLSVDIKLTKQDLALRDKLIAKLEEEREKLVAMLKATRHLMGGLHTLGWANMDSGPEAPKCISHSDFKYLLYNLQQPVDEALKACAGIEVGEI